MNDATQPPSVLEGLSDAEYDRRVGATISPLMDRLEDALVSDDAEEGELFYAAAPTALRNVLAQLIAEECLDQPRPFKLVKEMVRDLELERVALAILKELQAERGEAGDKPD